MGKSIVYFVLHIHREILNLFYANLKLNVINYNGRDILTRLVLQEHGEKLQLALVIREQLYSKYFISLF